MAPEKDDAGEGRPRLSGLLKLVKPHQMRLFFRHLISNSLYLCLGPLLLLLLPHLPTLTLADLRSPAVAAGSAVAAALAALYAASRPRPVYLVDFACFKPGDSHRASRSTIMAQFTRTGRGFSEETVSFQRKMLERCGIGDSAYIPESLLCRPVVMSHAKAKEEAETVVFGAVDELFRTTGVAAKDVGILVVNCSVFNPSPSYTAMIVNRYEMREDVVTYNLAGMGCSAGLIAVDLVRNVLQVHPNSYALVVSTENMTLNAYLGTNRSMLVSNSLFRLGGAAILLSNRRRDRRRSKYQLVHTVRTNKAADDLSFSCVTQAEDDEGRTGIALSKDLMAVAGLALKANISTLGPLVLPISEQLLFLAAMVLRKVLKLKIRSYVPDFKLAFDHFCIHAGGRAVLDELEQNLDLSPWHMEPSRMTLYRFGNTSSSSLWYELSYCEAKARVRAGDRVWQIAFGSGFKCNSAVWRALEAVDGGGGGAARQKNPWTDEIDKFPVLVPRVLPLVP